MTHSFTMVNQKKNDALLTARRLFLLYLNSKPLLHKYFLSIYYVDATLHRFIHLLTIEVISLSL